MHVDHSLGDYKIVQRRLPEIWHFIVVNYIAPSFWGWLPKCCLNQISVYSNLLPCLISHFRVLCILGNNVINVSSYANNRNLPCLAWPESTVTAKYRSQKQMRFLDIEYLVASSPLTFLSQVNFPVFSEESHLKACSEQNTTQWKWPKCPQS